MANASAMAPVMPSAMWRHGDAISEAVDEAVGECVGDWEIAPLGFHTGEQLNRLLTAAATRFFLVPTHQN